MASEIEVRHVSDTEIWVGSSKTTLIEGSIIFVEAVGSHSAESAQAQIEINDRLARMVPDRVNYLIDLNRAGKSSPEARKIWKEISDYENTGRVALFGLHPVARVLASFVMSITTNNKVQFFRTKEEGIKWINKQ